MITNIELPSRVGKTLSESDLFLVSQSEDTRYVYKFGKLSDDLSQEYQMMVYSKSMFTVNPISYVKRCIIMPAFLDGDAFTLLTSSPVNESIAKQIFYCVFHGLAHFQRIHVIHHDIKLENIFIIRNGDRFHAVIGDFEYAERVPYDFNDECYKGTKLYMAPEILLQETYSYSSDIWSAGISLATFLLMKFPYEGKTPDEILDAIDNDKLSFPSNISSEAQDLVRNLLCVNPLERLTAEEALQHPWFNDVLL